jgi:hypothetical protein
MRDNQTDTIEDKSETELPGAEATPASKGYVSEEKTSTFADEIMNKIDLARDRRKILFARSTAQLVSVLLAPTVAGLAGNILPERQKALGKWVENALANDNLKPLFRSLVVVSRRLQKDKESREKFSNLKPEIQRHDIVHGMGEHGKLLLSNIAITQATTMAMNKILGVQHADAQDLAKAQAIDTGVYLGSMVTLPFLFPRYYADSKNFVSNLLHKVGEDVPEWPGFSKFEFVRNNIAKLGTKENAERRAMSLINYNLPDYLGFGAGMAYLLSKQKRNQREAQI